MLITIDKRGSINIPLAVRKELGLKQGANLDLTVTTVDGLPCIPWSSTVQYD